VSCSKATYWGPDKLQSQNQEFYERLLTIIIRRGRSTKLFGTKPNEEMLSNEEVQQRKKTQGILVAI